MTSNDDLKAVSQYLGNKISQANLILFTGAGLSLGLKDLEGRDLPTGRQLAGELWKMAFPDIPYDDSPLAEVYQAALRTGERQLLTYLRSRLSIAPKSIPDWYREILNQPWLKIYTLNIDNFFEAASVRFDLQRPFKIGSMQNVGESGPTRADALPVTQLNGTLADLPHGVTFSTEQYAQRLAAHDPFYLSLTAELLRYPFVFIGSTLDESVLWQYIVLRGRKGTSSGIKELRPNSLLVSPSLSVAREKNLSDYNIRWIKMGAEEFTQRVLVPLKAETASGIQKLAALAKGHKNESKTIPMVTELIQKSNPRGTGADFLLGSNPTWNDIVSGRAIMRDFESAWLEELRSELDKKRKKTPIYVFTGTAGDGKSTALMQAASKLSGEGKSVAWISSDTTFSARDLIKQLSINKDLDFLFIDDADIFGGALPSLLNEICDNRMVKCLAIILRASKVDRELDVPVLDKLTVVEHSTAKLSDNEIHLLLDLLRHESLLGVLKGRSATEQFEAFKQRADRQLIVAMIEATSGVDFSKRVWDEFSELDDDSREIYCLVATATSLRHYLTVSELMIGLEDASNSSANKLQSMIRRGLLLSSSDQLRLRHRVIASKVIEKLAHENLLVDFYGRLAYIASLNLISTLDLEGRLGRLLKQVINHTRLLEISDGVDRARAVYSQIESLQTNQHHFWLQRGSLELEAGNIGLAENYLNQAQALNGHDALVTLACAHLEFKKANLNPRSPDSRDMMKSAFESIHTLIKSRGQKDPYPYHVLGSQGLTWCRKAIDSPLEKQRYLEKLIVIIDEGLQYHRHEDWLPKLRQTLQAELLSLAVK